MGSIVVQIIKFNGKIAANKKSGFYVWKHFPKDHMVTFAAVPTGGDNPPDTWYTLEITDVGYSHIAASGGKPGEDRQVRYKVNNPNPFEVTYEVHATFASP